MTSNLQRKVDVQVVSSNVGKFILPVQQNTGGPIIYIASSIKFQ